jgi:hypothetical protein
MIAPDEALPACADNIIPIVVSQLYGLVGPTATVAQICCLRRPEVCTEALYIAWWTVAKAFLSARAEERGGGDVEGGL